MTRLGKLALASLAVAVALFQGQAYADDRQRPDGCAIGMRCEDPDWSGYSVEGFAGIGFDGFAEGVVPDCSLSEQQSDYLEENHPTVIHRPPVKAGIIVTEPAPEDDGLIALTRRMFEGEGMAFHPLKLM